jgi:hypothetical protein
MSSALLITKIRFFIPLVRMHGPIRPLVEPQLLPGCYLYSVYKCPYFVGRCPISMNVVAPEICDIKMGPGM